MSDPLKTDVAQQIAAALTAYGPVSVTTTTTVLDHTQTRCITRPLVPPSCTVTPIYRQETSTVDEVLTAANIRVVSSSPVTFGEFVRTELPTQLISESQNLQNCSTSPASQTVTIQLSFQRTATLAISQSLTHVVTGSVTIGLKIGNDGTAFNVGGSVGFSDSGTTGQVSTTGDASTVTRTLSGSDTVPARSAIVAQLNVWPVQYQVPFTATVVVDADLNPSNNDKALTLLSQVLTEAQRTFQVSGTISADDASEGQLVFYDIALDPNACKDAPPTVTTSSFTPREDQQLFLRA